MQKFASLETQIGELRSREGQLRSTNKVRISISDKVVFAFRPILNTAQTLRDELKKVQSSAALLERQRNPGVGFWAQGTQSRANVAESPIAENGRASPRPSSPAPSVMSDGGGAASADEEVNLEYLRNIILQFLEHKEMRVCQF